MDDGKNEIFYDNQTAFKLLILKSFWSKKSEKMLENLHSLSFWKKNLSIFETLGPVHGWWEEWDILRRPDGLGYCGGQCWRGCLGNPQTPTTQHWPRNAGYFILLPNLMCHVCLFDLAFGSLSIFMSVDLRSNTWPPKPLIFVCTLEIKLLPTR